MKYIILALLLFTACTTTERIVGDTASVEVGEEVSYISEVRLTKSGFDIDEIITDQSEITIFIEDDLDYFLTLDGERIAAKELNDGDRLSIELEQGRHEVFDEKTKAILLVNVE